MRAIVDIGTNTILMLVARRDEGGRVHVQRDEARITRLGRGAAASGRLDPDAVARSLEVLSEYRRIAEADGAELEAVATEGLRMAADRDAFLERAHAVLGRAVRLIDGDEEARLSYLSVARESEPGPLRVLDIGGGSTELVVGRGAAMEDRRSHPIGSVRLTERCVAGDPPTRSEIDAIEAIAREALASQPVAPHPELHGLAGTVTTAAALLLELPAYDREAVDRSRFSVAQVEGLRDRLAVQTLADRIREPVLPPGRADVIVAGLTILLAALRHCGADTLVVRDRGLRFALV